jgi:XRE family transcriptional regulator, fatty acid utilization regulator
MANERPIYLGPRLRRLRREQGLTQADMARDLDISASYVALLERNQRPVTADMLLRIARTYRIDMADLGGDGGAEDGARLAATLKDPIFADIDLPALEVADLATNFPGMSEALIRLYTAYREEQLALATFRSGGTAQVGGVPINDPVGESRRFLAARQNSFPAIDDLAELLAARITAEGGMDSYCKARHGLTVRRIPADVMMGAMRRLDRHRGQILLDETLDAASEAFHLALQLSYIEMAPQIRTELEGGTFATDEGRELTRRALASYAAAAILMPYAAFAKAVETKAYDMEALARQFRASFEQVAHRLTTLQKPGEERVPFFFIRIDPAGNVSKRLDGAGFPFASHGGACPLWSVHHVFKTPRDIVTQWIELPDGQKFFSIARTVTAGGGTWGAEKAERAIALGCDARHAHKLIYAHGREAEQATPIGVTCRLCHRPQCTARSAPPIGREMLPDDYRRSRAPFGFSDAG